MRVLYLDDYRNPDIQLTSWHDVTVVRSCAEFVDSVRSAHQSGKPFQAMTLDYNLGDEYTGGDCVRWLCKYCDEENMPFPQVVSHSSDPWGRDEIMARVHSYMNSHNVIK